MTELELVDGVPRGDMFLASLKDARATVIGHARQTTAAARLLHDAGARVRVEPVASTADLRGERLIVVAASAALDAPAVVAARAAGVAVLGELDLGWCATEADTLAVASSPAARGALRFTHSILARQGRPVVAVGDAERELLACAPGFGADGLVLLEVSPAQLATAQVFRPRVAVILGRLEGHEATASSSHPLLAHQTPRDCVVLDADDAGAPALADHARARVVWCSASRALDHGVYVADGRIAARLNGRVEDICPVAGRGVVPAVLAAVACALWTGMAPEAIGAALTPGTATPAERAGDPWTLTAPAPSNVPRVPASSVVLP